MSRKHIDCRDFPGGKKCSVAVSADSDEEVLDAITPHAVGYHGYPDTPETREQLRGAIKSGNPIR